MREFTIRANDAGQRLDRFMSKVLPRLPTSLVQKMIRLKRIKCNGSAAGRDTRLCEGDHLQCYLNDEFFEETDSEQSALYLKIRTPQLRILYEDENLLLLDKQPGMLVHEDDSERVHTLINHLLAYLYAKHEWDPSDEQSFTPALCNRIDRNTGGIVIAAKNAEALRFLNEKIRRRELTKQYLCICRGEWKPAEGTVSCFLRKDEKKNLVAVYQHPIPGGRSAVTKYRTLQTRGDMSLVRVTLLTGRTHQIRASFADRGHPLLGDGRYGDGEWNRKYGESAQALYAYRLRFDFPETDSAFSYLRGKSFTVRSIPFCEKYFPKERGL